MPRVNVKDKRKQQLMEANIASIAKRGLADTTIAHVSKGADMSRGIVNFYFTSKEKMMLETLLFLTEEYNAVWQEAVKQAGAAEPMKQVQAILAALTSDKLCTAKRLAVWTAFLGHAGTHSGYAKILRSAEEPLAKQLKELWLKSGLAAEQADQRAQQLIALIRGHYLASALSSEAKRPSYFLAAWEILLGAPQIMPAKPEKPAKLKAVSVAAKPKNPAAAPVNQLDFGDLFSKG